MADLKSVPQPPEPQRHPQPADLRDAVAESMGKMAWLGPSDDALKALALRLATEIETAIDRAEEFERLLAEMPRSDAYEFLYKRLQKLEAEVSAAKAVGWLGQQLQSALRDLGGTPATRRDLGGSQNVSSRLAQLRQNAKEVGR